MKEFDDYVACGTMADVAKLTYAKYQPILGKFQDNFDRIKNVIDNASVYKPCYCRQFVWLGQRSLG